MPQPPEVQASIVLDPKQLVAAAVASIFEQHDPEALARALATTALTSNDRFSTQTVLESIVGTVVGNYAKDIITEILEAHRDEFISQLVYLCEDDVVKFCAQQTAAKIKAALPH